MMRKIGILIVYLGLSTSLSAEWDPDKLQDWEKETIKEVFITLAENSVPSLLFEALKLTHLGDQIQNVPPLQFLAFLMRDPKLKDCMRIISRSYFKWPAFMDGLQTNMEKEVSSGRLFQDLPHFANLLGVDYNKLKILCEKAKWEELVRSLLY